MSSDPAGSYVLLLLVETQILTPKSYEVVKVYKVYNYEDSQHAKGEGSEWNYNEDDSEYAGYDKTQKSYPLLEQFFLLTKESFFSVVHVILPFYIYSIS